MHELFCLQGMKNGVSQTSDQQAAHVRQGMDPESNYQKPRQVWIYSG